VALWVNTSYGPHHPEGWTGVDISPACNPDIVADLAALPFEGKSVDRIFACHVCEHLEYFGQLPAVLAEFRRVLANDGQLCVVGPDIERAILEGEPRQLAEAIVAWPPHYNHGYLMKVAPQGHAWTPTEPFLAHALLEAGFEPQPYSGRLRELGALGWPLVNTGDWQNGFICTKGALA
jgi:SAM-dependent methyltransferase